MTTLETITAIATPVCTAIVAIYTYKNNKVILETKNEIVNNTQITNSLVKDVSVVKTDVNVVKTQTDGIKDELVLRTKELGEAVGKAIGRTEQKAETENAKPTNVAPIEVVVVNEPLQVTPSNTELAETKQLLTEEKWKAAGRAEQKAETENAKPAAPPES